MFCLFGSQLYLRCLEQCLVHSRHFVTVCWINEWVLNEIRHPKEAAHARCILAPTNIHFLLLTLHLELASLPLKTSNPQEGQLPTHSCCTNNPPLAPQKQEQREDGQETPVASLTCCFRNAEDLSNTCSMTSVCSAPWRFKQERHILPPKQLIVQSSANVPIWDKILNIFFNFYFLTPKTFCIGIWPINNVVVVSGQ